MIFDAQLIIDALPTLITASGVTLQLTVCILLVGLLIGLLVALANTSANPLFVWLSEGYILVFRGTPALVQLFIIYFGLGQFECIRESVVWLILREAFWCAVIALGMNSGAYVGKMFAGALKNVPKELIEAGKALGLSPTAIFITIKAPLALRTMLPAYGNEVILSLKATALASTITLQELMGEARLLASETYAPYEIFISAGIIYLILVTLISGCFTWLEQKFALINHQQRPLTHA